MSLPAGLPPEFSILIVDDLQTMRRILLTAFKQMGFQNFSEAENGVAALEVLRSTKIDLIVSDWEMPKMMGIDLLKAVRADEKMKAIPFLMVTAESQKENILKAANCGVSSYIVKPFTSDTLEQKLVTIFKDPA